MSRYLHCALTRALLSVCCLLPLTQAAAEPFDQREAVRQYVQEVASSDDLDAGWALKLLGSVESQPRVVELMSRPAEKRLTWGEYRPIFIKPARIEAGQRFLAEHQTLFDTVEARYGVPRAIIAAIIGVETFYGRITGDFQVLAALATLAFDYPPRATFFRGELTEFLRLAREEKIDAQAALGSYAGAMGWPQFIPSSYRAYAVDFDDDGQRNLFSSLPDVIASVGHYLEQHGWQRDQPIAERWHDAPAEVVASLARPSLKPDVDPAQLREYGFEAASTEPVKLMSLVAASGDETWVGYGNFYAITRYNHSALYAMAVYQLSQLLAGVDG